jgi:N-acetylmuramoyl-L-alanine amidase
MKNRRVRALTVVVLASLLLSLHAASTLRAESVAVGAGKTIFIDPGHGGTETGAVHYGADGNVDLIERDVNLQIGLKLRNLLQADGFAVAMSRTNAGSPNTPAEDRNGDGRINSRDDSQAIVDKADESGAMLFVSIHNNGATNKEQSGTEIWYNELRTFAGQNLIFAKLLEAGVVGSLRAIGYPDVDRGLRPDTNFRVFQGRPYQLFVLGTADGTISHPRATNMPGALGESLFLTNDGDAAMLRQERTLDAIAQGYRNAIVAYVQAPAQGAPAAAEFVPQPAAPAKGPAATAETAPEPEEPAPVEMVLPWGSRQHLAR